MLSDEWSWIPVALHCESDFAVATVTLSRKHPMLKWRRGADFILAVVERIARLASAKWLRHLAATGVAAIVVLLGFSDPKDQQIPESMRPLAEWCHQHRLLLAVSCVGTQVVIGMAAKLSRDIWIDTETLALIRRFLDTVVQSHFPNQKQDSFHYRATLFWLRRIPGLGSWLRIVARSGDRFQHSRTIFSVDRDRPEWNTGIAGMCWWHKGATTIPEKPLSIDERVDYKRRGWLTDEEIERLSVPSSVFLAAGIRVDGDVLGVLVLDSNDDAAAPKGGAVRRYEKLRLELAAQAIEYLIARGKKP